MAARRGRTQAVFYRDAKGREPVVGFLEELLTARPLAAAKIGEAIEEYLNGRSTDAPPPEFPISSQIEAKRRMADFQARMDAGLRYPPRAAGRDAPLKQGR